MEDNLAPRIVTKLVMSVENKHLHLYMDNIYCDPHLLFRVREKGDSSMWKS